MPYAIRCALVIPKDYPEYMDFARAGQVIEDWLGRVQAWFVREVGMTFDYEYVVHRSNLTIYEIALADDGVTVALDGCGLAPVPEGQGMNENKLWHNIFQDELGWRGTAFSPRKYRHWAVIIGAGGWAGGRWGNDVETGGLQDFGEAAVGDWRLRYAVTGEPDPCCVRQWGPGFCTADPGSSFGHEILHSMGVWCHDPNINLDDVMTAQQRTDLVAHNANFLYLAPVPPPDLEPEPVLQVTLRGPRSAVVGVPAGPYVCTISGNESAVTLSWAADSGRMVDGMATFRLPGGRFVRVTARGSSGTVASASVRVQVKRR